MRSASGFSTVGVGRESRTGTTRLTAWALALGVLLCAASANSDEQENRRRAAEQFREEIAFHVGTLAYVYGYPMVDLSRRMHDETHRIEGQPRQAPVNRFARSRFLVTPETQGGLRAPNTDTLYFSGWFDLREGPVVVHAPDTAGRYYTMAVTNFYSDVQHLGRRTTGTGERMFALVGPGWEGELPEGLQLVDVETQRAWILGRLLVDGVEDFPAALALLDGFWAAPLRPGEAPTRLADDAPPVGEQIDPLGSLEYFRHLNDFLRRNPPRRSEAALLAQFDSVGIGPASEFDPASLDAATRRGLERAIESGGALVAGASSRAFNAVNGWITLADAGRFVHDYLLRASVALGGYANLPEESVYPATLADADGQPLSGDRRYRLHFPPGALPPVGAFWSLSVYDASTRLLVENPIGRYSIGDRSPALVPADDGSVTLFLQADAPASGANNWLPTPPAAFMAVMRLYEPRASVLDGRYRLPPIEVVLEGLR